MKKKRGTILTESLISMMLFLIGLMALLGLLTIAMRMMLRTQNIIPDDMQANNVVETQVMKLSSDPNVSTTGTVKGTVGIGLNNTLSEDVIGGVSADKTNITVNCDILGYGASKHGSMFYYLKRKD